MPVITMRGFSDDESRDRLHNQEALHLLHVIRLEGGGARETHPALLYHQRMLDQVRGALEPREGKPPAIEEGMEQQAWRNISKPD